MSKEKHLAALFDLDGVVLDTEWQYDHFWQEQGKRYCPEIPAFNRQIKGQTLDKILKDYFAGDVELQQKIFRDLQKFENEMDFPYVPGVVTFIRNLQAHGVRTALVTSSNNEKMSYVMKAHPEVSTLFECMITANKITRSKPNPECYLLAARELQAEVENCYVFEDSFSGIEAGRNAGMKVIGLSTTNPKEKIEDKVNVVIPDFTGDVYEVFMNLMS